MEILSCENLTFCYNGAEENACENIDISVNKGDLVLVMGKSGCGKTTLLSLLKKEIAPVGKRSGEIRIFGQEISQLPDPESAAKIGFLMQDPDSQAVTDKVYSELCFGLENLGFDSSEINRRVGETVNFFGLESILHREVHTLSGGQKQLVNLCACMTMSPEILILDEPLSRLDPVSAGNFVSTLLRLNRELGTTVIIAEHNAEEIFCECSKVLFIEKGRIVSDASPEETVRNNPSWSEFFPCSAQLWLYSSKISEKVPLNVRDGKRFLEDNFQSEPEEVYEKSCGKETILSCENLWLRYEQSSPDVLKGVDFELKQGEIFSIVGSNGAGKSTLIKALGGIIRPYRGKIRIFGKPLRTYKNGSLYKNLLSVMPQNPYDLFIKETVREDLEYSMKALNIELKEQISEISQLSGISHLLGRHPYDLSGGEAQRCALARILLSEPKIILLDEPVKGLDPEFAKETGVLMENLKKQGVSILCVTHDLEFAAQYSDRCGLFFDGKIFSCSDSRDFFAHNRFYTTAAARISSQVFKNTVTFSQIAERMSAQEVGNEK